MPVWQLFVPEDAYSADDKIELGKRVTSIYSDNFDLDLPRFYTTVFFHEFKPESYVVGGEMRGSYVHASVLHIARTHEQVAEQLGVTVTDLNNEFLKLAHEALNPYVADRGYELEFYVQMSDRDLWNIDGMPPPPPWSDAERRWAKENKNSPYLAGDQ